MQRGTQIKLAKKTGYTQAYFSKIINGKIRPSWEIARDVLAPITGTPVEVWMNKDRAALEKALEDSGFINEKK